MPAGNKCGQQKPLTGAEEVRISGQIQWKYYYFDAVMPAGNKCGQQKPLTGAEEVRISGNITILMRSCLRATSVVSRNHLQVQKRSESVEILLFWCGLARGQQVWLADTTYRCRRGQNQWKYYYFDAVMPAGNKCGQQKPLTGAEEVRFSVCITILMRSCMRSCLRATSVVSRNHLQVQWESESQVQRWSESNSILRWWVFQNCEQHLWYFWNFRLDGQLWQIQGLQHRGQAGQPVLQLRHRPLHHTFSRYWWVQRHSQHPFQMNYPWSTWYQRKHRHKFLIKNTLLHTV